VDTSPAVASLREVVAALEQLYPPEHAQSWDRVGLVAGDPDQPVRRVLLAVDPTLAVIAEARERAADLVVTHHPLLLRGIHSVATTTAKGAAVVALVVSDTALYCAHTNADVADPGVGQALARACGLGHTEALVVTEGRELGRVGDLTESCSLGDLARRLADRLPPTAGGIRVSGPPEARVRRVAVLGGAGDTAFPQVRACDADVYVTSDLRHHPALEAREEAAVGDGRPYLVDAGHFASEWLWLPSLAERLGAAMEAAGTTVEIEISSVRTDPWDFVVGTAGPETTTPSTQTKRGMP
jgi:dinuclear metal center YbgI/SA1388 family protein